MKHGLNNPIGAAQISTRSGRSHSQAPAEAVGGVLTQADEEEGEHDVVRLAPGEPRCLVELRHEYTDTGAFEVEQIEGWGGQRGWARRRVSAAR